MTFLQDEVSIYERTNDLAPVVEDENGNSNKDSGKSNCQKRIHKASEHPKQTMGIHAAAILPKSCLWCGSSQHDAKYCKMSIDSRYEVAKSKNACVNCLQVGHQSFRCWVRKLCAICKRKHDASLQSHSR